MSNNKQSSIQWIVGKLGDLESMFNLGIIDNIQYYEEKTKLLEQAKAMHKEEIKVSVKYGFNKEYYTPNYREQQELFEQYYNETYGGNNEQR